MVILSLLCVSVFAPMVLFPSTLKMLTSAGWKEFVEDLSNIKYRSDRLRLRAIEQETGKGLKELKLVVFKERNFDSVVSHRSVENNDSEQSEDAGEAVNLLERNETNHERKEDKIMQITNSVQKDGCEKVKARKQGQILRRVKARR